MISASIFTQPQVLQGFYFIFGEFTPFSFQQNCAEMRRLSSAFTCFTAHSVFALPVWSLTEYLICMRYFSHAKCIVFTLSGSSKCCGYQNETADIFLTVVCK